jgi:hypothetical protein
MATRNSGIRSMAPEYLTFLAIQKPTPENKVAYMKFWAILSVFSIRICGLAVGGNLKKKWRNIGAVISTKSNRIKCMNVTTRASALISLLTTIFIADPPASIQRREVAFEIEVYFDRTNPRRILKMRVPKDTKSIGAIFVVIEESVEGVKYAPKTTPVTASAQSNIVLLSVCCFLKYTATNIPTITPLKK